MEGCSKLWCIHFNKSSSLTANSPKAVNKTNACLWTTQITLTCIGGDRTNDGVKFCILSHSIPWCFSDPSLLQTVQLVLLTKANVKGRLEEFCQLWICSVGPELLSSHRSDIGQGEGPSEWAMVTEEDPQNRPKSALYLSVIHWGSDVIVVDTGSGAVMKEWPLPVMSKMICAVRSCQWWFYSEVCQYVVFSVATCDTHCSLPLLTLTDQPL